MSLAETICRFFKQIAPWHFIPDQYIVSVKRLTPAVLREQGIEVVAWDVDGSLMPYHDTKLDSELEPSFRKITEDPDLENIILSNCDEERFDQLVTLFKEYPVKLIRLYERREKQNNSYDLVLLVADKDGQQCYTASQGKRSSIFAFFVADYKVVRKPDPRYFEQIALLTQVDNLRQIAMVGDRGLTDISGARQYVVRNEQGKQRPLTMQLVPGVKPFSDPFGPLASRALELVLNIAYSPYILGRGLVRYLGNKSNN